jgi:hypothetical protein
VFRETCPDGLLGNIGVEKICRDSEHPWDFGMCLIDVLLSFTSYLLYHIVISYIVVIAIP